MNELEAYELSELDRLDNLSEEDRGKFKVTNSSTANWVFRKIKYVNAKMKEIDELAEEDMQRINNWREHELKKYTELKLFFEGLIKEHILEQKRIDKNYKLSTPYGSAYVKTNPEKWTYDETALLKWLEKNNSDLINITKTVDKNKLKKLSAVVMGQAIDINSGEVIDGVTVHDGEKNVIIKIND